MREAAPPADPSSSAPAPLHPTAPTRQFLARWRGLQQSPPAGLRPVTIAVTASFTVELLLPYLGVLLSQRGLLAHFRVAPFNQIYQSLLDPAGPLRQGRADVTLVLPRVEDLCAGALAQLRQLGGDAVASARRSAQDEVRRLASAVASYAREAQGGALLCATLPPPATTALGVLDASHPASQRRLTDELNLLLWQQVPAARGRLFDLAAAVADYGVGRAYDDRLFYLSRCPFSDGFLRHLADLLCRSIAPLFVAPAKVVVLDLDNTLWGGIIGEDGLTGIALGDSGAGAAYAAFQEALLDLRQQGLLLCLASKNNEADALEVFDRHPAMRIRRQHLTAWQISWQPKSESLRRLAEQLSLGLSSFVFIDDNPVECEEVSRLLPEVHVLRLPEDPSHFIAALRAVPALDRMVLTDEDLQRADQYAAEQRRSALHSELAGDGASPDGLAAYLRSLELRVVVRRLTDADVPRVAQLTQKTNQFNLTTTRRSEGQVAELRGDPSWRLYTVDVTDRFGHYGLTGVAFAHVAGEEAELDTLLLSCRVLGRGVETAALRAVAADLRRAGVQRLRGRFAATAKNAPARSFLPTHGFLGADVTQDQTSGILDLVAWLDERGSPRPQGSVTIPPADHIHLDGASA